MESRRPRNSAVLTAKLALEICLLEFEPHGAHLSCHTRPLLQGKHSRLRLFAQHRVHPESPPPQGAPLADAGPRGGARPMATVPSETVLSVDPPTRHAQHRPWFPDWAIGTHD